MPPNRKCFIHNTVVELCFRTQERLPFTASPYMAVIIKSILASALNLYNLKICHFIVMGNHLHMIVVVDTPEDLPLFVGYFKRESALAVNALLGRRRRSVWEENYDSPIVLDGDKVVDRIVHLYANPAEANLEESIERYPNLSSWQAFLDGGIEESCPRIPRNAVPCIINKQLSLDDQRNLANYLISMSTGDMELIIEPDAWLECFDEFKTQNPQKIKQEIIQRLKTTEEELRRRRSKPVVGALALRMQSIQKAHTPKKYADKMLCLSTFKELRIAYIAWRKELVSKAIKIVFGKVAYDFLTGLPPGLFSPGGMIIGNLNPAFVPTANNISP